MWRSSISAYLSLIAAVLGLCNAPVSLAQAATVPDATSTGVTPPATGMKALAEM